MMSAGDETSSRRIKFDADTLPYRLRRSGRAKRLRLAYTLELGLEVVIPARMAADSPEIDRFLFASRPWITRQRDHFAALARELPDNDFRDGGSVVIRGRRYSLTVAHAGASGRDSTRFGDDVVALRLVESASPTRIKDVLAAACRRRARREFAERARYFAAMKGLTFGRISVRDQKTLWGSCSPRGNLSFNWRLYLAEPRILDYVVAHEVAHLRHRNHGLRFQALLDSLQPGWRKNEAWLAAKGSTLVF